MASACVVEMAVATVVALSLVAALVLVMVLLLVAAMAIPRRRRCATHLGWMVVGLDWLPTSSSVAEAESMQSVLVVLVVCATTFFVARRQEKMQRTARGRRILAAAETVGHWNFWLVELPSPTHLERGGLRLQFGCRSMRALPTLDG